jgi:glycosyltransferase involved in cell wall biosynthesis
MNQLVSIIIPCYNDANYVEQSVQSALNQTYAHKEIILVDDGSNDETKAVLRNLELKITLLITQENQGQSKARNVGIQASKGNLILVLDSDDYFEPIFCEEAAAVFDLDPLVKIVTCQATILYLNKKKESYVPNGGNINSFKYGNHALGSCMFKKQDWEIAGKYDETMRNGWEDWEFYIRLLKSGGYTFVIQKPLFYYRRLESTTTARANKNRYDLWYYIFTKHKDLYYSDFDNFVTFLLNKIKIEEKEKIKNKKRIEFRIGNAILIPVRYIKNIFK